MALCVVLCFEPHHEPLREKLVPLECASPPSSAPHYTVCSASPPRCDLRRDENAMKHNNSEQKSSTESATEGEGKGEGFGSDRAFFPVSGRRRTARCRGETQKQSNP